MELTASQFTELLLSIRRCVFTTPTFLTFVEVVTGWLLSHPTSSFRDRAHLCQR